VADSGRTGRTAKEVFTQAMQRDALVKQEQQKAHASAAAKIARLKALRLARDAGEKDAAAKSVAEAPPARPARRKAVSRAGS
jgi:hypothetical protein